MGNTCSIKQRNKDKDNQSQNSGESQSYTISKKLSIASDKQFQTNNIKSDKTNDSENLQLSPKIKTTSVSGDDVLFSQTSAQTQFTDLRNQQQKLNPGNVVGQSKILKNVIVSSSVSVSDSVSLSSPPALYSPCDIENILPINIQNLNEELQNLLIGKINLTKTSIKARKIVVYVCAADSQDCHIEKGSLHNTVYPEIRGYCRDRGYELHIVDLHWKTFLEKQQDHEFPELCIGELTKQMEVSYIIPVIFLNNSLGTPLLPLTIETSDFQMALDAAENESAQSFLTKWYQIDNDAQPPCYRLQPISSHIPSFKENSLCEREKALGQWRTEIDKMLNIMVTIFTQELKDLYLTTVVEQEIQNTVIMNQELAKRCIWLQRTFIPGPKTPETPEQAVEVELQRRLTNIQNDLRNQLNEKHIVRLPLRYTEDQQIDLKLTEHQQYLENVNRHLLKHLTETIDNIIDEHQNRVEMKPSHGIPVTLFNELNHQTDFCIRAAQCSVNRDQVVNDIKKYILSKNDQPLIIYGPGGCGKTTLLAHVAQCCTQWTTSNTGIPQNVENLNPLENNTVSAINNINTTFLIVRFTGISGQSSTTEQIIASIANQFSFITQGHMCYIPHNLVSYKTILPALFNTVHPNTLIVIIIDGIDQVKHYGTTSLASWLPESTSTPNVKLILSLTEGSDVHKEIQKTLNKECFIKMPLLGKQEAQIILMNSIMQYNHSVNSKFQDCVLKSIQECTIPLYAKVLAWQESWWADKDHDIVPKGHVTDQLTQMFEELEAILGKEQVSKALALLTSTKLGICDSEMLDLLAFDELFHSKETYLCWAPACLFWSRLSKHLGPFLQWTLASGGITVQWRDNTLLKTAKERYKPCMEHAHRSLLNYYMGSWWENKPPKITARIISQETKSGKSHNRRKLEELPYQYYCINGEQKFLTSFFITDLNWIYNKICGSNCYQFLEDLFLIQHLLNESQRVTKMLKTFIENNTISLNYDGRQFYSQLYLYLHELKLFLRRSSTVTAISESITSSTTDESTIIMQILEKARTPPITSMLPLTIETLLTDRPYGDDSMSLINKSHESQDAVFEKDMKFTFDFLTRLPDCNYFVVTVSTAREEICVWDIRKSKKVRILKGIHHPINLIPVDQFRCIVLCGRELRMYDLDKGQFLTKLKGVMNQKMPFYGLHDQEHIVALSRNRMYVNLMNINSGDCVTTFKAGEDRFLNSLLVSGDGRILVCGDETQKPFPLLVWNLTSKKLMYDLRIPHHDFVTSRAAITYEGNFVCCVCCEVSEPDPNFIVVYDLQSGTLFKKWKPSCNTVSLEISSQTGCVISGLEDARILIWDLTTGNCRWTLTGHTAPVNYLRLDPDGEFFLSIDNQYRDRSIRLWDLKEGNLIAVYTPRCNITKCELVKSGKYIVMALESKETLVTFQLRGGPNALSKMSLSNIMADEITREGQTFYGNSENTGKIFHLNENLC